MKEMLLFLMLLFHFRCHVPYKSCERKDKHEVILQINILLVVDTDLVSL